jgi:hypothetical protein
MTSSMATKKKKTKKSEPKKLSPRLIEDDHYSVILSRDEILAAVQILSFAQSMFEQMAMDSHKANDEKSLQTWAARSKLSTLLYQKLRDVANIGEPAPGELH